MGGGGDGWQGVSFMLALRLLSMVLCLPSKAPAQFFFSLCREEGRPEGGRFFPSSCELPGHVCVHRHARLHG